MSVNESNSINWNISIPSKEENLKIKNTKPNQILIQRQNSFQKNVESGHHDAYLSSPHGRKSLDERRNSFQGFQEIKRKESFSNNLSATTLSFDLSQNSMDKLDLSNDLSNSQFTNDSNSSLKHTSSFHSVSPNAMMTVSSIEHSNSFYLSPNQNRPNSAYSDNSNSNSAYTVNLLDKITNGEFSNQPFGIVTKSEHESDLTSVSSIRFRNEGSFLSELGRIGARSMRRQEIWERVDNHSERKKKKNIIIRIFESILNRFKKKKPVIDSQFIGVGVG